MGIPIAALLIGILSVIGNGTASSQVFVAPEQADRLRQAGAAILDTRDEAAFTAGHAPNASQVDWRTFSNPQSPGILLADDGQLAELISALGVDNHRAVVVMGDWAEGWGEEGRIYWMLDYLGHDAIHVVEGGFDAWHRAGLPVVRHEPNLAPGLFSVARRDDRVITLGELVSSDLLLFDVREREEYEGATPYGAERGGHIPGARHLAWRDVLDAGASLRSPEELRVLFGPADTPVVTYCTGGVRSGFVYTVLRSLGRDRVANYAGSWWEYAASPHPIAR